MLDIINEEKLREELEEARREHERRPKSWRALERVARCLRLLGDPEAPNLFRHAAGTIGPLLPEVVRDMSAGNLLRLAGDEGEARLCFEEAHAVMIRRLAEGSLGLDMQQMVECSFLLGRYEEAERLAELFRRKEGDEPGLVVLSVAGLARARRIGSAALARELAERFAESARSNRISLSADGGTPTTWDWYEIALRPVEGAEGGGPVAPEVEALAPIEGETDIEAESDASEPVGEGRNLRGADLSGKWLMDSDLMGADMREARLVEVVLSGSNLRRADLRGANLSDASLVDADLREADLRGANLEGADLNDAILEGADLRGATLAGATLDGTKFRGANLEGADLSGASINHGTFERAQLAGARVWGADMRAARLSGLDLRRVVDLKDAGLTETDLTGANLSGLDLSGCPLADADLRDADLSSAALRHANLRGANLRGANLSESDLSHADFSEADLTRANLRGAKLEGSAFGGAVMDGVLT